MSTPPYYPPALQQRLDRLLALYQNQGYPFAWLEADSMAYTPTATGYAVYLRYVLHTGRRYHIRAIVIEGQIKEKPVVVYNLLRLQPGDVLDRSRIEQIPQLMDNSLYYRNTRPPRVVYEQDSATVYITTEQRRSNRFEALVGMLPPRQTGERLQWTGTADLQLVSAFRRGEQLALKLDLLPNQSQNLDFRFRYPYLLGTPFSGGLRFGLLRRDTTFINRHLELVGEYQFSPWLSATFSYRTLSSRMLSTRSYREVKWPPPAHLDSENRLYGAGFRYRRVDYLLNPRSGYELNTDLALGTKRFGRPAGLDSLDDTRLLATQPRQELRISATAYVPMGSFTCVLGGRFFYLGLKEYFLNDLPFIGGTYSLRGFNENQFQVSQYVLGTLELRLRMSTDAYIGLFAEGGYMEQRAIEIYLPLQPVGTGLSLSIPTPAGQLLMSYAIGTLQGEAFAPQRGRVHLGLAAQF